MKDFQGAEVEKESLETKLGVTLKTEEEAMTELERDLKAEALALETGLAAEVAAGGQHQYPSKRGAAETGEILLLGQVCLMLLHLAFRTTGYT